MFDSLMMVQFRFIVENHIADSSVVVSVSVSLLCGFGLVSVYLVLMSGYSTIRKSLSADPARWHVVGRSTANLTLMLKLKSRCDTRCRC